MKPYLCSFCTCSGNHLQTEIWAYERFTNVCGIHQFSRWMYMWVLHIHFIIKWLTIEHIKTCTHNLLINTFLLKLFAMLKWTGTINFSLSLPRMNKARWLVLRAYTGLQGVASRWVVGGIKKHTVVLLMASSRNIFPFLCTTSNWLTIKKNEREEPKQIKIRLSIITITFVFFLSTTSVFLPNPAGTTLMHW